MIFLHLQSHEMTIANGNHNSKKSCQPSTTRSWLPRDLPSHLQGQNAQPREPEQMGGAVDVIRRQDTTQLQETCMFQMVGYGHD